MGPVTIDTTLKPTLPTHELLGYKPDKTVEQGVAEIAQRWLTSFDKAVSSQDPDAFLDLIDDYGYWRDLLAFTNDQRTLRPKYIRQAAADRLPVVKARNAVFATTPPSLQHPFEDVSFIEVHFDFETQTGPASGIAKLIRSAKDGQWRAWILFTLLEGIHGHPEQVGFNRAYGKHNATTSWDEDRAEEAEFKNSSPDVLIVGAGHNGLEIAARLKLMGTSVLNIDKNPRVGDNWRFRYKSLSLHDPVWANHFPHLPFPPNWAIFTPSGKLAKWLEFYAEIMELNVWTSSTLIPEESDFDESINKWRVTVVRGDGSKRRFEVGHIVLATGLGGGFPKMPKPFPGQETFKGTIVHSGNHGSGADWTGKKALVVGSCTSAHDVSLDLVNNGVDTTMLQRTPTYIMTVKNGMPLFQGPLYSEGGLPPEQADRQGESTPKHVVLQFHQRLIPKLAEQDKEILEGIQKAGFKTTFGPSGTGFIWLAWEKGGGYYFDTGACAKVASGDIKVKQGEIDHFTEDSVVFKDGSVAHPELVVFATGYTGYDDRVRMLLGEKWVKNMKTVWSLDEEGELRGIGRESGIPNVYFSAGALAMGRMMSKLIALQIKTQQLGIFGERYTLEVQQSRKAA